MRRNARQRLLVVALLAVSSVGSWPPGAIGAVSTPTPAAPPGRTLRLVHAVTGAPRFDVYVDGKREAAALDVGDVSDFTSLGPGPHQVEVRAVDRALARPAELSVALPELPPGATPASTTIVIAGTPDRLRAIELEGDARAPAEGRARVRVVNASGEPAGFSFEPGPVIGDVAPFEASAYAELRAGPTTLSISSPLAPGLARPASFLDGSVTTVIAMPGSGLPLIVTAIIDRSPAEPVPTTVVTEPRQGPPGTAPEQTPIVPVGAPETGAGGRVPGRAPAALLLAAAGIALLGGFARRAHRHT